ncbi:unnamed protein product, partial [Callosobruchus maculatus]
SCAHTDFERPVKYRPIFYRYYFTVGVCAKSHSIQWFTIGIWTAGIEPTVQNRCV